MMRLRTLLSVTLALVLVWTSGLQAARAWFEPSSSQQMSVQKQSGMAKNSHTHHSDHDNHGQTETGPQDPPSCLLTCLDASPRHYLAAQMTRAAVPELSALYPYPSGQFPHWHEGRDLTSIHQAPRVPQRSSADSSKYSGRTILLHTARFRI